MFKKVKKKVGSKRARADSNEDESNQVETPATTFEALPNKRFKKGISTTQLLEEPPSPKIKE